MLKTNAEKNLHSATIFANFLKVIVHDEVTILGHIPYKMSQGLCVHT